MSEDDLAQSLCSAVRRPKRRRRRRRRRGRIAKADHYDLHYPFKFTS